MNTRIKSELKEGIVQAREILTGKRSPTRVRKYDGRVLVEIVEHGKTTWRIENATDDIKKMKVEDFDSLAEVVVAIRKALRQSQKGFAEMLGVSLGTVQGWEQGRRIPTGSARRVLNVAATSPTALIDESELIFA